MATGSAPFAIPARSEVDGLNQLPVGVIRLFPEPDLVLLVIVPKDLGLL